MHYITKSRPMFLSRLFIIPVLVLLSLLSVNPPRLVAQKEQSPAPSKLVFAAIGDSGTGTKDQIAVAQAMERSHEKEPFDFVVMLGDNIYGTRDSKRMVQKFELPYRNLLARGVKFHAALGNHDVGKGDDETQYTLFNMQGKRYYTFVRNGDLAQFFALDSTQMDRPQLDWLEKELAASKTRWKIAYFHHPLYSSGRRHGSDLRLRLMLEPLFVRYGVQVVLNGHDHFYERFKPQHGVSYFVSGGAGKLRRGNIDRSDPLMAVGNDETLHFMLFDVSKDEVRFRAIDTTGIAFDSGVIQRPDPRGLLDNGN